ncbi:type VI secretion system baseplate subunit TssG [Campylobacter sp. 2018MI35]|uniref:type VI secretion system baseplate subunit TssG n=1 Tax=Campylobacter sp. 2018MI34 TaxID=2800582 RepID=UPI001906DFEF|nr:type VI secretion system baseplate subunit TssG [Campylobacter sp. 2018MI34]
MRDEFLGCEFYSAIRKLLKTYNKKDIFLRANPSLKHPNKEIEAIKFNKKNQQVLIEIIVNFMGLQGSTSQLPSYMLDKLSRSQNSSEWTLFFDFFNHYILWLFFESKNLRNYARSFKEDFSDTLSKVLFSLLGIENNNIAKKYLQFAPLLLSFRRPKYYIEKALENNFNLYNKISIIENIPHQIIIPSYEKNKLGFKNNILGNNFILGEKITSYNSKIAVYIKNIEYEQALNFFPGKKFHQELKESIIFLTNNEFNTDLYLKIKYNKKMGFTLGDKSSAKLGLAKVLKSPKNSYSFVHIKL